MKRFFFLIMLHLRFTCLVISKLIIIVLIGFVLVALLFGYFSWSVTTLVILATLILLKFPYLYDAILLKLKPEDYELKLK
ncbi:hypothetical protein [Legionella brunensis]|uniref:Transmembrane protein n=1 Tax=Legionella brunensis TaxID=29422 RepID=A0A0W0SDE3_9GAMM|nr:hypothetical protein [Legionella brunensis]KTC81519.1 hypothetical protein Lbru_2039 [Legionella brunensis]